MTNVANNNANNNANNGGARGLPTLRDVAARAGVSLATASCALGQGRRGVSDAKRLRVERAAAEIGYELRPRGRRRTRPLTIGVVVPDVTNSFFGAVVGALDEALRREGHRILLAPSGEDAQLEDELVAALSSRIDALAITPAGEISPATHALARRGLPVVVMDRDAGGQYPCVVMDNCESARRATMVLVEAGFERIALVNGPARVSTARERTEGYLAALAAGGLLRDESRMYTGEFTYDEGRRAVAWLLRAERRPDAIFSTSAILTSGVLMGLRERGLAWPDDLAVVGFGDGIFASLVEPAVTVVEQPTAEMGQTVARMLISKAALAEAGRVVLSSKLVLRDSHWRGRRDREARPGPRAMVVR